MSISPPAAPPSTALRGSFWQRRVVVPIMAQLTQGVTPEKISLTLALGVSCGLFPFLGFTTALCFLVALVFRLNQPLIHVINQLLWPVHLPMIAVYVKSGAWLLGVDALPFNAQEIARIFWSSQQEFWSRFGLMGIYALTAWLISVPVIVGVTYYAARPVMRKMASTRLVRS